MFTEEMAITLLKEKAAELGRVPKKEDFDGADVARIKSKLGPWPRALESAGLKEKTSPPKRKENPKYGKSMRQKKAALQKLQKSRNKKES